MLASALLAACSSSSNGARRTSTTADPPTTSTTVPITYPQPGADKKPPIPATGAYFGTWRGPGPGRPSDFQNRLVQGEQLIGRKYAIDQRYYDWGSILPSPYERWTAAQGRVPMVNLCACHFDSNAVVSWKEIASGADDAYIGALADGFASFGKPVFFVFEGEAENRLKGGEWGGPADYRNAFRHFVEIFRAHRVENVAFMWVTSAYAFEAASGQVQDVKSMYPGDDVVDWIATDPYNFFYNGSWHSLSRELDSWYRWVRAAHPDKPLALAEWGSKEDPKDPERKAQWFDEALHDLETKYRAVKAVVYFDEEKHERGTVYDWRIDTSQPSVRAFAHMGQAPWFDFFVRREG
jgi:hypothetical protein